MSNYYLQFHQDTNGDLVDISYFHRACAPESLKALGEWPCPEWPDYAVYCEECKEVIHQPIMVCEWCDAGDPTNIEPYHKPEDCPSREED